MKNSTKTRSSEWWRLFPNHASSFQFESSLLERLIESWNPREQPEASQVIQLNSKDSEYSDGIFRWSLIYLNFFWIRNLIRISIAEHQVDLLAKASCTRIQDPFLRRSSKFKANRLPTGLALERGASTWIPVSESTRFTFVDSNLPNEFPNFRNSNLKWTKCLAARQSAKSLCQRGLEKIRIQFEWFKV